MTGIAALIERNKVYMAGDSAAVGGGHYLTSTANPKVFKNNGVLIGYTSSFAMGNALQYRLHIPPYEQTKDLDRYMATQFTDAVRLCLKQCGYARVDANREQGGTFLVGIKGAIFQFDTDFHSRRIGGKIAACGAGESVILGSLYSTGISSPQVRLRLALQAAQKFTTSVRAPFTIISQD